MSLRHPASRAIVSALVHEGGYWTQRELLHLFGPAIEGKELSKRLYTLSQGGYIRCRRKLNQRPRYGVSELCKPITNQPRS